VTVLLPLVFVTVKETVAVAVMVVQSYASPFSVARI
jgi:hypothetical protein